MNVDHSWKNFWEKEAKQSASDFEYDHGTSPRQKMLEDMSNRELVDFIDPIPSDVIFDAGCGTGAHTILLHSKVKHVFAMDFNSGAVERCQKRLLDGKIGNAEVMQGGVTSVPLPDSSADKIICMSVLQYLDDNDVLVAFKEFKRVLKNGGTVILHVKNRSSIYLSTLCLAKKIKLLLRRQTWLAHYRPFRWYIDSLAAVGFEVVDYNSFNWLMIDGMPKSLLTAIQKFEFEHYKSAPYNSSFIRRHGSELKIKARIAKP